MADNDQNPTPDWLEGDGETGSEDWMQGLSFEADSAPSEHQEGSETPNWTAQGSPTQDTGPNEADWLNHLEPVSPAPVSSDDEAVKAELPDWLAGMEPEGGTPQPAEDWRQDFEVAEPEPTAPAETPDWLNTLQPPAPSMQTPRALPDNDDGEDSDFEFGWIDSMIEEEEAGMRAPAVQPPEAPLPTMSQPASGTKIDWESEFEEAAEPATDIPDWLQELQPVEMIEPQAVVQPPANWMEDIQPPDDLIDEPVMAAAQPNDNEFDWRDDFELQEEAGEAVGAAAMTLEPDQPSLLPQLSMEEDEDTVAAGQPVMHTSADNAPDWLNAMVPGVDLDYDAPEDSAIETDFIEDPVNEPAAGQPVQKPVKEFDWLMNIVEEETQPEQLAAAGVGAAQGRFVFSKPPVWLRSKQPVPPARAANGGDGFDVLS
jgi:hypothetical protein